MQKYPKLFSPIKLGNTVFRSRLFASPISQRTHDHEMMPTHEGVAFYARKAAGGAASVCVGDCIVDAENGLYGTDMLCLEEGRGLRALSRLSEAVTRRGAVAAVELQHAGLYANAANSSGGQAFGPVDGVRRDGTAYFEMPEEMILRTIERFVSAARWAKTCGYGMVTLHGGHGWLLGQFLSPKVNTRRDMWGGEKIENRVRMTLAIAEGIKKACGAGFPIEIRISGSEVTPDGYDLDAGIEIARALDGHVDLIHVSAGHHENPDVFCVTHPSIFLPDSANVKYAAEIKKHVKTPVASVGAHSDPDLLEEIILSGQADVVELARALLADPDLPRKARAGRAGDIRPCLRCLQCFSGLLTNGQIYCAVNPEIGNEIEYCRLGTAKRRKKVAVAGGGVAGMQAAITLARRGHSVTLFEKSDSLGGALRCEENVPFKSKIRDYIIYQEHQLFSLPVELKLGVAATPESLAELQPDVVIAAIGARPALPKIAGLERNPVFAEDVYYNPTRAKGSVAILGGGLVGTELAIFLAGLGREVTVIEMAPELGCGGNILHQLALDVELRERNVALRLGTRALEVTKDGVRCDCGGIEELVAADTVICAVGQSPLTDEAYSLRDCAPEFYVIGDCVQPKNITAATSAAEAISRLV